ncbi:hypothetical protein G7048_10920 [Diaphorobacter sp. HDW4B]|uniref:hypothetical protein n=1 Tax=Diaphorobacter sp. HDW4B TaxID=2714925 RepID=UPI00140813A9|nr:hypothetical protein [Diaphorobacter sp. HDW4B]QIL70828.1 hypothetical protein G7048_10920 [Diaphorobacter sp. HDW4B]
MGNADLSSVTDMFGSNWMFAVDLHGSAETVVPSQHCVPAMLDVTEAVLVAVVNAEVVGTVSTVPLMVNTRLDCPLIAKAGNGTTALLASVIWRLPLLSMVPFAGVGQVAKLSPGTVQLHVPSFR